MYKTLNQRSAPVCVCVCLCVSVTGKYLRVKRINFQLPYDIHWQCAFNKVILTFVFKKKILLKKKISRNLALLVQCS